VSLLQISLSFGSIQYFAIALLSAMTALRPRTYLGFGPQMLMWQALMWGITGVLRSLTSAKLLTVSEGIIANNVVLMILTIIAAVDFVRSRKGVRA
jgi:hypothetical protein